MHVYVFIDFHSFGLHKNSLSICIPENIAINYFTAIDALTGCHQKSKNNQYILKILKEKFVN